MLLVNNVASVCMGLEWFKMLVLRRPRSANARLRYELDPQHVLSAPAKNIENSFVESNKHIHVRQVLNLVDKQFIQRQA